jgi:DNA-binding phage protein
MASGKPKTGFDKYVQARMQDRDFASAYIEARAEIDAVDGLMRHLDEARRRANLSKADLARRANTPKESVRRLLTAKRTNPTLQTVVRLARVVGLRIELARATKSSPRRGVAAKAQPKRSIKAVHL